MSCKQVLRLLTNRQNILLSHTTSDLVSDAFLVKRFAGHSKWSNIKHIKGAKDAEKSALFSRISYQIKTVLKDGGSTDPKLNSKLAQVVDMGKAANMPIDKINDAIKKAIGSKDDLKQHFVEIKAGSVLIVVELLTSKLQHSKSGINTVLRKAGGQLADNGYCMRNFTLRGIVLANHSSAGMETALEDAIEAGAEDVTEVEVEGDAKELKFLTHPNDIGAVKEELLKKGYVVSEAKVEYVPNSLVELDDEQMQVLSVLVKKLEKCDDVNKFQPVIRGLNLEAGQIVSSGTGNAEDNDFADKALYEGHIEASLLQKGILTVGSALTALLDPSRADMVAILGETTGAQALKTMHEKMQRDPEGAEILRDKPRISSSTTDLDALRKLKEGTLGRTYVEWLDTNGVSPDTRLPVQFVDDSELAYVMQRYREAHDLIHTVLGMPTNMLGEVAVKWVEGIQTGLPMCIAGGIMGAVRLKPKQRQRYLTSYLPYAIRVGGQSKFLMNIYYEKRWEQNLEELRLEVGIEPPPLI